MDINTTLAATTTTAQAGGANIVTVIITVIITALVLAGIFIAYKKYKENKEAEGSSKKKIATRRSYEADYAAAYKEAREKGEALETPEPVPEKKKVESLILDEPAKVAPSKPAKKSAWDKSSFVLAKLPGGRILQIVGFRPDGRLVLASEDDHSYIDRFPEDVESLIGEDESYRLVRVPETEFWLFSDGERFFLEESGKVVAEASLTSQPDSKFNLLKTGDELKKADGTVYATFMVTFKGDLMVQYAATGKNEALKVEQPLYFGDKTMFALGSKLLVYSKDDGMLQIYDENLQLIAK